MSYRSPWTEVGQIVGNALTQVGGYFLQKQANQGEQSKQQVQEYVSQAELALADPNYKWKPGEREAAEAFITQAKNITKADPLQAGAMWQDLQQRGIKIPSTTIKQGNADAPMTAEKTLTPYQGGISGFFGDVNRGVTQAGQQREQYELDLANLRELEQLGNAQQHDILLQQMQQKYGKEMMQGEQAFAAEQTAAQMDVAASATATDRTIATLKGLISTGDPKDRQIAQGIMKRMEKAGLQDYDWATLQGEFAALGSTSAEMDYTAKNESLFQTTLTTDAMSLQNDLSRQSIKIGDQQYRLGELQISNQEWLQRRRNVEASLADTASVQALLGTAYAQGDTGFINERIRILESGDESDPQYQALTAAGITAEGLENKLTTMEGDEAFRLREQALQDELINEEYTNIFFRGEGNRQQLFDTLAKRYSPEELQDMMADETGPLGTLIKSGQLGEVDMRAIDRQANVYRVLENEEVIAPRVERAYKNLEVFAAVPADRQKGINALNATVGTLIENGVMSPEEGQGLISTYQESWDYQTQLADDELATSASKRLFAKAQADLMRGKVLQLNAEDDPLQGGMSPEQERLYNAQRGTITDVIGGIMDEGELLGCGFTPEGFTGSTGNPQCVAMAGELRAEKQKLIELGATLQPGGFDVQGRVVELADRIGTGQATPQEQREFQTYEMAMGEDTIAGILGVPTPAEAAAQAEQEAAAAPPPSPVSQLRTLANDPTTTSGVATNAAGAVRGVVSAIRGAGARSTAATDPTAAQATPAIDPNITRDLGYRSIVEGNLSPAQAVEEMRNLARRYNVDEVTMQRFIQQQQGGREAPAAAPTTLRVVSQTPEFTSLVQLIKSSPTSATAWRQQADAIATATGLTTTEILELAQNQAGVGAPGYRAPWSGQ